MRNTRKTILVIDDQRPIRTLLGTLLGRSYRVVTLSDGLEALRWLHAHNRPDLILLDLQMPRMNGHDFLRRLRTSGYFRHLPVVIISGDGDELAPAASTSPNVAAVVAKPFNPITLSETLTALLSPVSTI